MISTQTIVAALSGDGWMIRAEGAFTYAAKRITGRAESGAFSLDGARVVTLRLDPCGFLQRLGAWGDIERQASLFRASDAGAAIAEALA